MALERTLSIVKPDAVAKNVIGEIYSRFEQAGLKVVAARMKHLSKQEAEGFYAVHRERPFFGALVNFMISGPVMIQVLEGEGAVLKNRDLMGAPIRRRPPPARSAPTSPSRSTPTPCTAPTPRRRPRSRSRTSSRHRRSTPGNTPEYGRRRDRQPPRPRPRGPRALLRRTRLEAVPRAAGVALAAPAPGG